MSQLTKPAPVQPGHLDPAGPPPSGAPRGRRTLLIFWAAVFLAFLAPSPGKMTFETKLGVALDPWQFLSDLGDLWHARAGFGGIFDQYAGYLFPSLPYYALMDLLHVPVWLAERLWLSIIVTTAFWGALRLAERLKVGSAPTRLLGAVAYALWPTFTIVIGSTSAAAMPGAVLPWVLLPLTSPALSARRAAARSALLIPFMGGVNAGSTLASLLPVGLYLLSRPEHDRAQRRLKWTLIGWWTLCTALATLWWVVPLLLLGAYGENFLPYVEQGDTTTSTMAATEFLRGAGNWVGYLHFGQAWLPAGWTVATSSVTVVGSAFAAALGLGGLARRDLPERRWLVLTALVVTLIALAGYGRSLGGPFHETVQTLLDGPIQSFRNIYKFQPGLALALALGLAHLTAVVTEHLATRDRRRGRLAPALAALLILPGLAWPYLNGTILQPGAFTRLPGYWSQTTDWLEQHTPEDRALVVPATAHGIYTWGSPIDQPLDVLAKSPWAQRDFVPFGTPGSRRVMDAVEQALMTGAEVPGLRDFLTRAGLYTVVVRNDLDPDQAGYVPPQTVRRTLEESGYRKVKEFGPLLTGGRIPDETPIQVQGLYSRQKAVEIYEPASDTPAPGRVGITAVSDTVAVSGGPEALLQLSGEVPGLKNRPTVLTGDPHPGLGTPSAQITADGLRRADTRFGLVNTNTSYTYTADERNPTGSLQDPGTEPKQILPIKGVAHQTTAVLRGARSVTASSYGNWLFQLPQYDPVNAFDGNPDTAWAEGSPGEPDGQWLRIGFDQPTRIPSSITVTPLPGDDGTRAAPTQVRVETDRGSADSPLRPDGTPQSVKAPEGKAKWLRIRIVSVDQAGPSLSGAGFSDVSVPGVQVTRLLALPRDAEDSRSPARVYSLHRGTDLGGLSPAAAEAGLHRQFSTQDSGSYDISIQALAMPGQKLDRLMDEIAPHKRKKITATADSTGAMGQNLSPRNLVDGDLTTAWIAGDKPVIHLRWPGKKSIDEIVLGAAGGLSTRPEEIQISSPYGAATAGVDANGVARFDAIRTDRLDITVTKTASMTVYNPDADTRLQLPVGLNEVYLPALEGYQVPQPDPEERFSLPCGQGPPLAIDGTLHATKASGLVSDLTERRPVKVQLCADEAKDGSLRLGAGRHRVEAGDQGALAITDVTLTRGALQQVKSDAGRTTKVQEWGGDHRTVTVGAGAASYLQTYENVNDGWKATLNGKELKSLRIDGWQQAWLIPAGEGGTVHLDYEPAGLYTAGLVGGAVGVAAVAVLAFFRVRRRSSEPEFAASLSQTADTDVLPRGFPDGWTPPPPGRVLGILALTVVVAVAAGPIAILVPVLAILARLRPGVNVPVAVAAMAGAGIIAATGAGDGIAVGEGAFSAPAQALALLALSAALVTVDRPDRPFRWPHQSAGVPDPPPDRSDTPVSEPDERADGSAAPDGATAAGEGVGRP
ncbi:DUF3367 domain-containing protein [Streptomyces sp. SID5914]|nr:alpha-(1->3)-arabinofuranosyltransferase family protein [Streptomyces sp. SID5914]MZG19362.1 DUF3367 domain-containing protein [Streptomyces sp. SID5914]